MDRGEPTGRISRPSLLASAALHVLLLATAWGAAVVRPGKPVAGGQAGGQPSGGGESVSYLDLSDFPTGAPSGGAATGPAAQQPVPVEVAADSTGAAPVVRTREPLFFPDVPTRPRAPSSVPARGGGAPAVGGAPGVGAPGAQPGGQAGAPGTGVGAPGAAARNGGGTGGGLGDRLNPGYRDPRLYVPRTLPPERPKTDIERYREHLQARIDEINDSSAAEADRRRRSRNWLYKDKNGREWGIAEGGVPVVNGHRLPTQIVPPIPRDRDRENAERETARQRGEIDRQVERTEHDRNFRERTRIIRARADSIRNARKRDGGGG
jgi:hypothetical protein